MAVKYLSTDYLYASGRIRALEASLVGKERLGMLLGMKTAEDIREALAAEGAMRTDRARGDGTEALLLDLLRAGLDAVRRSIPDPELVHIVTLPFDCHNIKTYLKCHYRGISPAPLLIDAGTVAADDLVAALTREDVAALPRHMGAAVAEAREAFAKTNDPRELDFALDRALFADLAVAAAGLPFAEQYVAARADLTNLIICLRLLRGTNPDVGAALFCKACVPAGTLEKDFFLSALAKGESELLSKTVIFTPYGCVAEGANKLSLEEIERRADDYLTAQAQKTKRLPFGAEIPLAYLLGLETSIKNLRILLAGKKAGLDESTLKERLRESYV